MVPMLEERDVVGGAAAHGMQEQLSPLPQMVSANSRSPNRFSNNTSAMNNSAGTPTTMINRERKAGSNLPAHLLRQGNEIVQNIYLDEVFAALKEVLSLRRPTLPAADQS